MLLNSDGIFFAEVDGRKCLFVCELKSLLWRCSNQSCQGTDCGNFVALAGSGSILQSLPEWEYHGVIVSYEPTGSQLVVASKLTSRAASFSRYLCTKKHK